MSPQHSSRALRNIHDAGGLCVRAFLRALANVPTQCRKVHADRGNSCIVRAVNDKRAVNDSSAIQGRRHLLSPRTNLRAAGRVGNRASKDAHGRQHVICSHQGCDSSRHAWSQLSFEHTSQPTVRLIETTNGRRHLPSVFGPGRRSTAPGRRRPAIVVTCAPLPSTCAQRARSLAIYTIGPAASTRPGRPCIGGGRRRPSLLAPALSASAASSSVFALARHARTAHLQRATSQ